MGLVGLETTLRAAVSVNNYVNGVQSADPTQAAVDSYFRNVANGDSGFADLDAATAALEISGGDAASAMAAWGTLQVVGEVFQDALR